MKTSRVALSWALLSCALGAPAAAQVHQVAFEWDASQPTEKAAVDTCIAASPDRVIVASNQVLALFERDGDPIVSLDVRIPDTTPPIDPKGITNPDFIFDDSVLYIDPRIEYDPYSGQFWLLYQEGAGFVHLAISRDDAPNNFLRYDQTTQPNGSWYVYTGSDRFDFSNSAIGGTPYLGGVDHPVISFDESRMWLTSLDGGPFHLRQGVIAVPRSHSGGSILAGQKPPYSALKGISPADLPDPQEEDEGVFHYAIQEPFDDVAAGQFFISTSKGPRYGDPMTSGPDFWDELHTQIRLGGAWIDGAGALQYQWEDLDISAAADQFFNPSQPVSGAAALPATPEDQNWKIKTLSSKFDSGVLTLDVTNAYKIFAAHHVVATNQGQNPVPPVDRHELRWYVIDPDLANFPGGNWNPQIEVVGAAPIDSVTNGETYEGAIAVNPSGIAYITFTRSGTGSNGWPSLVRSRLSNNYTTATTINQFIQAGPPQIYDNGVTDPARQLGTDYCDMQPDYVHCGYWAIGAIADCNDCMGGSPPTSTSARAIWITEIPISCNQTEMNGDGVVDAADLAIYLDYYAKGDQRADMDRSGTITTDDYQKYSNEYAKR